jgi:hypothetical protein
VPFGGGLVVALVVLPALLAGQAEGDVVAVVLSGFGFCVFSRRPMRTTLLIWCLAPFLLVCAAVCGTCLPNGWPTPAGAATAGCAKTWPGRPAKAGGSESLELRGAFSSACARQGRNPSSGLVTLLCGTARNRYL